MPVHVALERGCREAKPHVGIGTVVHGELRLVGGEVVHLIHHQHAGLVQQGSHAVNRLNGADRHHAGLVIFPRHSTHSFYLKYNI